MIALPPSIPPTVAEHALAAWRCDTPKDAHLPRTLLIADMGERNTAARFWVVDMRDPLHPALVLRARVAHGSGSDPKRTGYAQRFSNVPDSNETALGAYHVAERYVERGVPRYRLDGMSATDFNARMRDIVFHASVYVDDTTGTVGYSEGCVAVSAQTMQTIDKRLGVITGAVLWVDGPGVTAPACAPRPAWSRIAADNACSVPYFFEQPIRACTTYTVAGPRNQKT
jgi:hypothetical protein